VAVVDMVVVGTINDHVRFVRTIDHILIINSERHIFDGVASPSSGAHSCKKVLQYIVVSCHRRKVAVPLIRLDAESGEDE